MNVQHRITTRSRAVVVQFRKTSTEDTQTKLLHKRLWNPIKNKVLNFNIFNKRIPSRVTTHELRNGIYSTRIFVLLLTIFLAGFILFSALVPELQTVTIPSVTQDEYEKLEQKYSQTLRCPCEKISIEYEQFSSIQPIFHPICSSIYINEEWFSEYLSFPISNFMYQFANEIKTPKNFRIIGPLQFQLLSLFCNLSNRTVHDSIAVFNKTMLITSHVVSSSFFKSETDALINLFISSTINTFKQMVDTIVSITQKDEFSLTLRPLKLWWQDDNAINSLLSSSSACTGCETTTNCLNQAVLYPPTMILGTPAHTIDLQFPHSIVRWYGGCSIIGSLLVSNFECFFSGPCLMKMEMYIFSFDEVAYLFVNSTPYPAPYHRIYTVLNSSNLIRSTLNTSIKEIIRQLMVESWNPKVFYSKYYLACKPTSCTYTYIGKRNFLSIVSLIIGLIGGLTTILKLVIPPLVAILRRKKKPTPSSKSTIRRHPRRMIRRIRCHPSSQHRSRP